MIDVQNDLDSTKPFCLYRGNLIPEAPILFGELWGRGAEDSPGVLLIPGLGGLLDSSIRKVASLFAEAGLLALAVDRPGFGESGGEPRNELNPKYDVEAFVQALRWLSSRTNGSLGVWGTSFGAAEALLLAESHPGVRAVVAQAPPASLPRHPLVQAELERTVALDIKRRTAGFEPAKLPLVSPSPKTICAIPGIDAWQHLTEVAPLGWTNQITIQSLLLCSETHCSELLQRATVPACVIGVRGDARALDESEIPQTADRFLLEGEHFDLYKELLPSATNAATHFFRRHLLRRQ